MLQKIALSILAASALFATPLAPKLGSGYDNPIPMCYPCPDPVDQGR